MTPDVVVAGGGPAGLSAAREAAAAGCATVVLEKGAAIGIPLRTSGASWIDELDALGVPSRFHLPIRRIRVIGPHTEAAFDYREPRMCILDVRTFYQWLAQRALEAGAELRLDTRVVDVLLADGRAAGVRMRARSGRVDALSARVVVDATGYPSALARRMGLHEGFAAFGVGAELDLYAPRFDANEAWLLVGSRAAPCGYAWAFPYGDGRVRLGVGVGRPHADADPHAYLAAIRARVPALAVLDGASAIEAHVGLIPLAAPRSVPLVRDGLVVAGDAAGQASSLVGEGIRYAMHAGRLAGRAVAEALRGGGVDAATLDAYPREWARRERNLRFAHEIYRRIVRYDDGDWDREIEHLTRLTADQFAQGLKGDFTLAWYTCRAEKHYDRGKDKSGVHTNPRGGSFHFILCR
jgi:digeranylgeranylglycerophospholipid reductase